MDYYDEIHSNDYISHQQPTLPERNEQFNRRSVDQNGNGIIQQQHQQQTPALTPEGRREHFRGRCLTWKGKIGRMDFSLNPFVTIASGVIIWGIIIWALTHKTSTNERVNDALEGITNTFTWLYILAEFGCALFVIYIYFKFGHLKLGNDTDVPEFNDFSYFCMTFTTGIALEIFYSGVDNPITYYTQADDALNYWGKSNSINRAQAAINITLYHWGLHGFAVYTIPGLLIGILTHRKGLPWSMRSCFYPLFGARIFGRLGDLVDILSIVCIMFGTAVALTYGSELLTAGVKEVFYCFKVTEAHRVIVIWILTAIATISLISGLHVGIKRLSEVCIVSGIFVLLVIVFIDETWFVMNVFVQSIGYYIQFLIGTGFYTAAFEQTGDMPDHQGDVDWMEKQTLFWWGWWISWAPLAGMFIARISKGRKISDVVFYCFFLPTLLVIFWMSCYGGIAIHMESKATKLNMTCFEGFKTSSCSTNSTNHIKYIEGVAKLGCFNVSGSERFYTVLNKYGDISKALSTLAILSMVVYYATSSDSTSLVIDSISSNGEEDPSLTQRVFWALTEGAAGTALVYYGDVKTVKPIPVVLSLPLLFVLILSCISLWRVLRKEPNWSIQLDRCWKTEYGYGCIKNKRLLLKLLISIFFPWYHLSQAFIQFQGIHRKKEKVLVYLKFALPFFFWIAMFITTVFVKHAEMFGWVAFVMWLFYSSYLRRKVRTHQNVYGNLTEDLVASCFYPFSIVQIHEEILHIVQRRNERELDSLPPGHPPVFITFSP